MINLLIITGKGLEHHFSSFFTLILTNHSRIDFRTGFFDAVKQIIVLLDHGNLT